ncbi:Uncharacterized phage-associated protein YdaU [Kosakonia radicincitans]|uniref:DUF1376 domain-containing protein n=1 Tax=Kosakonia radicincitans TaxID=283686 RepID=UPI001182B032|nr:DUF1376 domain-containing protein [Kosakonia radicincitans]VVT52244.1 Uncharacterized phage-associated protein YdaU [Kosakonia radicincitans]
MAALPYMQLYIADYLADTMHLSTEEHGAYLLLMFNYWQTGRAIPKNRLAKIARLSNERWSAVEASLKEFFNDNGTEWVQERIERDLEAVRSSVNQKSAAGKASARARKAKKSTEEQRSGNERSTGVESPFKQNGNGNPTNKDPDIDTDLKENPSLNAGEPEIPEVVTHPEETTLPRYVEGVDEPIGKFTMSEHWLPSRDFRQRAAQWGIQLPEPDYLPTELAEFSAYWKSESKVFTQIQWEQKFARHVVLVRSKKQPETGGKNHAGVRAEPTASRAVQQIREARERWEQENGFAGDADGMAPVGGHGRGIFEPMDSEERDGTFGYVDCADRFND